MIPLTCNAASLYRECAESVGSELKDATAHEKTRMILTITKSFASSCTKEAAWLRYWAAHSLHIEAITMWIRNGSLGTTVGLLFWGWLELVRGTWSWQQEACYHLQCKSRSCVAMTVKSDKCGSKLAAGHRLGD